MTKPGEGEQRHIRDRVLVAGSDKRQQTPPDSKKFRRAFGADRHPDCQTNQPVTQRAFEEQYRGGRGGFRQRD